MAEAIRDGLRLEAIAADIAGDGDTALELLRLNAYDIAVLDRDIPGPTGDEIAKRVIASGSGMPILMLTAADRLDDKATGFELGADDYLTKPFELRELVLRFRALDRRRANLRPPVREIAGLRLDPVGRLGGRSALHTQRCALPHASLVVVPSRPLRPPARLRLDRGHRAGVPAGARSAGRVASRRPHARPPDAHHRRHAHRRERIALPPDPVGRPQ